MNFSIVDAPGTNSYPLASYTFAITKTVWKDCESGMRTLAYLYYGMSTPSARSRSQGFGFVPLGIPDALNVVEEAMRNVTCSNGVSALPRMLFVVKSATVLIWHL